MTSTPNTVGSTLSVHQSRQSTEFPLEMDTVELKSFHFLYDKECDEKDDPFRKKEKVVVTKSQRKESLQDKKKTTSHSLVHTPNWMTRYFAELRKRLLPFPVILVLIYAMSVDASMCLGFNIAFAMSLDPDASNCFAPVPLSNEQASYEVPIIQNIVFFLAFPIMGWLADAKIGRGKAITLSIWLSWSGALLQVVSYCVQYGTCGLPVNIAKYGISGVALLIIVTGNAGFYSNMLAYGLDQMPSGSTTQVRSFVHWLVWALFFGFFFDYIALYFKTIYDSDLLLISSIAAFFVTSLAVSLSVIFPDKFEPSGPQKRDPYRVVYQVMKYAWEHKSPENRSALTYWEEKTPSRIDLGKEKYGGPFDNEEPEDVKAFWRIVVVFLSYFGFYIPYFIIVNGIFPYMDALKDSSSTMDGYASLIIWKVLDQQVFFLVPIFELLIFPMFPKLEYFFLNPMKGLLITYLLLLFGLCGIFAVDTAGHMITPDIVPCYFTNFVSEAVDLSVYFYAIPLFFTGLADFMSYVYSLEFICSQAPSNMSGMITGFFFLVRAVYLFFGSLLTLPFQLISLDGPYKFTCSFWILLVETIICLVGVLLYVYLSRKYRRRQRGEHYDMHAIIEENFARALDRELETSDTPSEVYIVVSEDD